MYSTDWTVSISLLFCYVCVFSSQYTAATSGVKFWYVRTYGCDHQNGTGIYCIISCKLFGKDSLVLNIVNV